MFDPSWSLWSTVIGWPQSVKQIRKSLSARIVKIEHLEERQLLSANAPVAVNDSYSVNENGALFGSTVLSNDTDADGDAIDQAILGNSVSHGNLTLSSDGSFTYTPTQNYSGTDSFTYFAKDSLNNETSVNSAVVTIQVNPIPNSPPVANSLTFNTNVNMAFTGLLTASDADSNPLTFSAGQTPAIHGAVAIHPDGTFTYTPNNGFVGNDQFSFKVNDGMVDSQEALVTVHVLQSNTAPVANPISISTPRNSPFQGTLTATDVDQNPLTYHAGTTAAAHGTVSILADGTFTYSPDNGFSGTDSFSFQANDGSVDSADALVTIDVTTAQDTAPTLVNGNGTTSESVPLTGSLLPFAHDAEGDFMTISAVTLPVHGSLTLNSGGTFSYLPNPGFSGLDSFSFKASDGQLESNVATFNLTVTPALSLFTLHLATVPGTIGTVAKTTAPLDATASLINVQAAANFANASLVVNVIAGADKHDKITVLKGSGTSSPFDVRGNRVLINGTQVAQITGGSRNQPLQVHLNSGVTAETVEAILQQIGLRTTRKASRGTRTIQMQVDANGSSSSATIDANLA
ncbi:MAG: repeat-containing protein [Planctomycetaceae bacterium]|nr:repeat-containing protein [Planctomycetaceae bacterium]